MNEDLKTKQEEQRNPKTPKSFWKELTWVEMFAITAPIIFLIYLNQSTGLILNFNNQNETRIINGIQNLPNTILYPSNAFVPKAPVSNSQTAIGIILYIICIGILLKRRLKEKRRATPEEAMNDLSKQLKRLTNIPLADGTTVPITDNIKIYINPIFFTRYKSVGDERKAFRYVFQIKVEDRINETEYYYKAWYHPWDWFWDGFYQSNTPLGDKDRCQYCGGTEYDEKVILSERLNEFRKLKKGLAGFGMR